MELFNGMLLGISKTAAGTLCRECNGGNLRISQSVIRKPGIGGQVHHRYGTIKAEVTAEVLGVDKADIAKFFLPVQTARVLTMPDLFVEVDDGTNGGEFTLTYTQPARITVACAQGDDAEQTISLGYMAGMAVGAPRSATTTAVNSLKGFTIHDHRVTFGGTDQDVLSFSLSNDLGAKAVNAMNDRTAMLDAKRFPTTIGVTKQGPVFSCVTSKWLPYANMLTAAGTVPFPIVIACTNGTGAENVTYTLTDMVPDEWNMPFQAEDFEGFEHTLGIGDGTICGRVAVA